MDRKLDVLLVQPSSRSVYQGLKSKFSAIEPPTWSLLLAQSLRSVGFGAEILDCDASDLNDEEVVERIKYHYYPRLVAIVCYGSEPNQGTTRMADAVPLAALLKERYPECKVAFLGSHSQALPKEVLALPCVDFVFLNEGVYALRNLLSTNMEKNSLWNVKGIGWKPWANKGNQEPILNESEKIVLQNLMDQDLPGYAWDLLDLNKYRCHFWHSGYSHKNRSPFAALYTSLGCPMKCSFCMINLVNRVDNSSDITAADSNIFRYWSPQHTLKQIESLVERGVKNIRISDEMFFLRPNHYVPLLEGIRDRWGDSLNMWAYARVDTVQEKRLELFRSAGVRWLCLGIEAASTLVRREVSKGSFQDVDIRDIVKQIESHDIDVISNFIFGLPNDTPATMKQTLDLACELNTSMANFYPAMSLPGTPLYQQAKKNGKPLPDTYSGFGFLSYESAPMGTEYLTPEEVLRFRDESFHTYYSRPAFYNKIGGRFGPAAVENIKNMLKIKLKRKLLGDPAPI